MSISSSKKYKSVYYAIYDNLKNIGNFKKYIIDNSETVVCFHFPHGYSKIASYMEIYKNGKKVGTQTFYRFDGENNIIKTLANPHANIKICIWSGMIWYLISDKNITMKTEAKTKFKTCM